MDRERVKERVFSKDVHGSFIGGAYTDDRLIDAIAGLTKVLAVVPEPYRKETYIKVESIGGYEDEHHVEVEIYFYRPETDEEMAGREARERREEAAIEESERAYFERLRLKFESKP